MDSSLETIPYQSLLVFINTTSYILNNAWVLFYSVHIMISGSIEPMEDTEDTALPAGACRQPAVSLLLASDSGAPLSCSSMRTGTSLNPKTTPLTGSVKNHATTPSPLPLLAQPCSLTPLARVRSPSALLDDSDEVVGPRGRPRMARGRRGSGVASIEDSTQTAPLDAVVDPCLHPTAVLADTAPAPPPNGAERSR